MGSLPWLVGAIIWWIVAALTESGWLGFWAGLGGFLFINYLCGRTEESRTQNNRNSRLPSNTNTRIRTPNYTSKTAIPPSIKKIVFKEIEVGTDTVLGPNDLNGINDAFTGELIETANDIYQCTYCKVCYTENSVIFLRNQNNGQCVSCQKKDTIQTIKKNIDLKSTRYNAEVVNLNNYKEFVGRVGLHPYDWTEEARRVWLGNPMFS